MTEQPVALVVLAAAWTLYFVLHSLLASDRAKARVGVWQPGLRPAYRLLYNTVAVLTLLPIAWLVWHYPGASLWAWHGAAGWLADGLALCAVGGFVFTLRSYDGAEFLGIRQWRTRCSDSHDRSPLTLSVLHRHVRHPWYTLALVIIWTRDMDSARLLSAVMITLYLVIGSRFEEQRLIAEHGSLYRRYRQRVPGLVPIPRRHLSAAQAERLLAGDLAGQDR